MAWKEEALSIRASVLMTTTMLMAIGATAIAVRAQDKGKEGEPMRGTWSFSASGTILLPGVPPIPAAAVGLMTFDPNTHNCLIQDMVNIGGTTHSRTPSPNGLPDESCTYHLGSDGQGSISVSFPGDQEPVPLSLVLVDHEREMRFIRADVGVAEGVAKLQ